MIIPFTTWMEAKMIINPKVGIQIPFKLALVMASKGTRKGSGTKAHIKSKTPKIKKTKNGTWAKSNVSITTSWDTSLKPITLRWDWKEGKFLGNTSVATLGPNLILLNYKVGINVVSCLLDFETMHLFVKPNVVKQLGWVVKKVVKPIRV